MSLEEIRKAYSLEGFYLCANCPLKNEANECNCAINDGTRCERLIFDYMNRKRDPIDELIVMFGIDAVKAFLRCNLYIHKSELKDDRLIDCDYMQNRLKELLNSDGE